MASQNQPGSVQLGGLTAQPSSSAQQQNAAGYVQSGTINAGTSNSTPQEPQQKRPSRNQWIKRGWGSRRNFQASYGLGMDPESIDEGTRIIKAVEEAEEAGRAAEEREQYQKGSSGR